MVDEPFVLQHGVLVIAKVREGRFDELVERGVRTLGSHGKPERLEVAEMTSKPRAHEIKNFKGYSVRLNAAW